MVALPPTGALVVFALIGVALTLFVTEALPPDITAIGVLVSLAVLEPFTGVTATDALAGFASPAVVTILAMYVLSAGVEHTGVVDWLGVQLAAFARGDERRLLGATLSTTGVAAGLVNNTPVVAVFIPMIRDLADRFHVSPSKFLLPLSFAAMLGGTLTLVGTSINLVASDLSATLLDHPIGLFEFTPLGVLVLVVGLGYLLTVGWRLTPARLAPATALTAGYDLGPDLAQVEVRPDSPLVGRTPTDLFLEEDLAVDVTVLQVDRETVTTDGDPDAESPVTTTVRETFMASTGRPLEAGDRLTVRANMQALNRFAEQFGCRQLPREAVDPGTLAADDHPGMLVEAVVPPDSALVNRTPAEAALRDRYDTTVLAVRRGEDVTREALEDRSIRAGDTLLLQTVESALEILIDDGDLVVTDEHEASPVLPTFDTAAPTLGWRAPLSVGILLAVVALAALSGIAIPVTALGGVVAMVVTGCLGASDVYDAVSWNVIFLLAGVLPLGIALEATGGAAYLGGAVAGALVGLPLPVVLAAVYLLAGFVAAVITPVATVVVLAPIAVDLAGRLDAAGFGFLLATLFGASAAFITPIGYQTNLMVYGPGGYRFTDFLRVGLPLQGLLAVVTTVGIVVLYPV